MYEQVLWDNLEGYSGKGDGFRREETYVRLWSIQDIQQKPSQYCKKKKKLTDAELGLNTESKLSHT